MKKTHSLIAACAGLVVALTGGLVAANFRTAEATSAGKHFARPVRELATKIPAATDLTRYGVLGDEQALRLMQNSAPACQAALKAAGVTFNVRFPPCRMAGAAIVKRSR